LDRLCEQCIRTGVDRNGSTQKVTCPLGTGSHLVSTETVVFKSGTLIFMSSGNGAYTTLIVEQEQWDTIIARGGAQLRRTHIAGREPPHDDLPGLPFGVAVARSIDAGLEMELRSLDYGTRIPVSMLFRIAAPILAAARREEFIIAGIIPDTNSQQYFKIEPAAFPLFELDFVANQARPLRAGHLHEVLRVFRLEEWKFVQSCNGFLRNRVVRRRDDPQPQLEIVTAFFERLYQLWLQGDAERPKYKFAMALCRAEIGAKEPVMRQAWAAVVKRHGRRVGRPIQHPRKTLTENTDR